jgi:hypothetical protein
MLAWKNQRFVDGIARKFSELGKRRGAPAGENAGRTSGWRGISLKPVEAFERLRKHRVKSGRGSQGCIKFYLGDGGLGGLRYRGLFELRIDAADDVGDGFCADQILFADLDPQGSFQIHDELEAIQTADTKIVDQQGIVVNPLGIDHEGLRQYRFDSAAGVQ